MLPISLRTLIERVQKSVTLARVSSIYRGLSKEAKEANVLLLENVHTEQEAIARFKEVFRSIDADSAAG